jgi:PAS domain S-box-containing protein
MAGGSSNQNRPLVLATGFFFTVLVLIIIAFVIFDFEQYDLVGLLFMTVFLCAGLMAKSLYDSLTLSDQMARTEQQITEDIFIASEELHTQLYQNSPVPYLLLDENGVVTSANIAAGRLYGVNQKQLHGTEIFNTLTAEENEKIPVLIEKYKSRIPIGEETVQIIRPDGEVAWVLLSLFQFTNAYGSRIGLLTLVDISKQKQIENAKAEFVSLASHQLRTPLAAVKWSAELLQIDPDKTLNEKQHKYIARLLSGTERMAILVDDFLRVSRFELGTFQPEFASVNIEEILLGVTKEQESKSAQKDLDVSLFCEPKALILNTDPNLVRMITSNLFSNAVKYSRPGGTINIGYRLLNETVILSVADNGMGIPMKEQERIFSKLFRASNATRNVPDGTGLGLYIAKEAAHVLKGKITFTSVQDVSTTFEVTLPLDRSEAVTTLDDEQSLSVDQAH